MRRAGLERAAEGVWRRGRNERAMRLVLAAIPPAMLTLGIPFANHVEPRIFGLPFLLAWIVGWIVLTPAFLAVVARLDRVR